MSSPSARAGYVDTRLGQLHYRVRGQGRPLLLLHPPPRSSLVYRRLMAAFEEIGGVRVIALDLPGFGLSCDLPAGITMAGIADVVAQAIVALHGSAVSVFGLHTGNKVAAALAAGHPAQMDRVILAGMTHSIIVDAQRRNEAMRAYVQTKPPTDPAQDPPAWRDEQVDRLNARGVDTLYAANYGFDLASVLPLIQAPTMVLELAVPQEESLGRQADALCALLRHGRAVCMAGDDRDLLQSRPRKLASVIAQYLNESAGHGASKEIPE
ncbi:MAG: alpha/beta fold hydrolase [Pseudomonadota bacterium]